MKRQAEHFLEEARRNKMYDFHSLLFAGLSQVTVFRRGWRLLATTGKT